jgi:hypothetical protein
MALLYAGIFDTAIPDVLQSLGTYLPDFDQVLVRVLDSGLDPNAIYRAMANADIPVERTPLGVVLSHDVLSKALDIPMFFGFDELWFLQTGSVLKNLPLDVGLTSDSGPLSKTDVERIGELMNQLHCSLALGDGCGLNCVTLDRRFWEELCRRYQHLSDDD